VQLTEARIMADKAGILNFANLIIPRMVERGGGARDLEVRVPSRQYGGDPNRVVVHLHIDCRDAMGANLLNTVAEGVADRLAKLSHGRVGLRILTNLSDRRLVRLQAIVPANSLATQGLEGPVVAEAVAGASRFADDDPYRAATHNKGIMNGVDAVVIATGNDWRGVEAGAHAFAATSGRYRPLSRWWVNNTGALQGELIMPMAVGTVGGTLGVHAGARLAQRMLGVDSSSTLATVIAAVGMASNLAALRALATEGIQRGHMACHRRATSEVPAVPEPLREAAALQTGERPLAASAAVSTAEVLS